MSGLNHLASLLRPDTQEGPWTMTVDASIDAVLAVLEKRSKARGRGTVPEDLQLEAVQRFWASQEIPSFRDAYLLSWGLCVPHRFSGPCVMEDRPRFQRVLDGVDRWHERPNAYRRCYQGLVKSYFTYDALSDGAPSIGRQNWTQLREYLQDHTRRIVDKQANPEWVTTAVGNRQLFSDGPCEPYVDALLHGDAGTMDTLCEQLGITKASWFLRELVLAQVKGATSLDNAQFQALMPRLLELLASNEVLRDRGLIMVLDRYARVPGANLHLALRDSSVLWWGNPWLPSNETRWGGVTSDARSMVADWLKLEFIETFFTKLAEDGLGDRRRMEFWKRYVKSISNVQFALGSTARSSRERDFVMLRKKMAGLICNLDASGANNAFIMTMGNLVAVEFSGMGNALYGYDAGRQLPFDTSKPLQLTVDVRNSLKHKDGSRILWLSHQDGIHGWDKWESMFEATLRKEFGVTPGKSVSSASVARALASPSLRTTEGTATNNARQATATAQQPYTRAALIKFANELGLHIEDKSHQGGSLWVRTEADDSHVNQVLTRWGFHHKPGKGWWK
jgi:hypothetical protein